jgi:hypothetical protein
VQSTVEIARVEGDSVKAIRPLSEEEVQEIKDCNKDIFDFNRHFKLVEYVLHNFASFKSGIEISLQKYSEDSSSIGRYDLDALGHEVNINLLNLMMSARTFLDHMETFIKREYGKDSEEINLFKKLAADEFDNRFSYKFMYKLRNYVQHCGMPPLSYSKTKVLKGEAPYAGITLEFDRDALLSGFDSWGTIVKPELEAQENKFNALSIVEEFVISILRIYIRFNDKTKFHKTLQSRTRIAQIISQEETYSEDDYCLLKATKKEEGKIDFTMSWIPASLFKKIENYLNFRKKI